MLGLDLLLLLVGLLNGRCIASADAQLSTSHKLLLSRDKIPHILRSVVSVDLFNLSLSLRGIY